MPSAKNQKDESPNAKVARGDVGAFFPIMEEARKTLKSGETKVVNYHGTEYTVTDKGHYSRVDKSRQQKGGSTMRKRRTNKTRRATSKRRTNKTRRATSKRRTNKTRRATSKRRTTSSRK